MGPPPVLFRRRALSPDTCRHAGIAETCFAFLRRHARAALAVLLVLGTVLVYWPALGAQLIWNGADCVTHPALRSWTGLERIWTEFGVMEQYYPLLHLAFWLQQRLWGDASLGYHVVSILAHAGGVVLFAFVLRRLGATGAWFAAALFAVHPVHVESVAWIAEQKNTLSLLLYLAAASATLVGDELTGWEATTSVSRVGGRAMSRAEQRAWARYRPNVPSARWWSSSALPSGSSSSTARHTP